MAKIIGRNELTLWFNNFFKNVEEEVKETVAKNAYKIERNAKMLCPIDTGHLRRSITTQFPTEGKGFKATVGTNVFYAPFVEMGTIKNQNPQAYLFPSFSIQRPIILDDIKNAIKKAGE